MTNFNFIISKCNWERSDEIQRTLNRNSDIQLGIQNSSIEVLEFRNGQSKFRIQKFHSGNQNSSMEIHNFYLKLMTNLYYKISKCNSENIDWTSEMLVRIHNYSNETLNFHFKLRNHHLKFRISRRISEFVNWNAKFFIYNSEFQLKSSEF